MSSRKFRIETALKATFSPEYLDIHDESHMHSVPDGAESHFKIICVSSKFTDKSLVTRHRTVNAELKTEFTSGLHALSLHLFTPEEWSFKHAVAPSPICRGGQQREQRQKSQ